CRWRGRGAGHAGPERTGGRVVHPHAGGSPTRAATACGARVRLDEPDPRSRRLSPAAPASEPALGAPATGGTTTDRRSSTIVRFRPVFTVTLLRDARSVGSTDDCRREPEDGVARFSPFPKTTPPRPRGCCRGRSPQPAGIGDASPLCAAAVRTAPAVAPVPWSPRLLGGGTAPYGDGASA